MSHTKWSATSHARYENLDVTSFLIYRANIVVEQPAGTTYSDNLSSGVSDARPVIILSRDLRAAVQISQYSP